ncbi:DUF2806 domain-containing protein [Solidesulfovibrio carbinolicus]|nr:DUF2806 domain-containing protein [Solidesulfovibrio carbinolicus]
MNIDISAKINADFAPLLQAAPKGVDRVYSCLFGKREAAIRRDVLLMAAKTQVEYQMILSGEYSYENGKIIPSPRFTQNESINPLQIEKKQEVEKLAGNVRMAVEALKDIPDDEISDKEVDDDFFARWRREAKAIGNEELQRLWGRLLAQEIQDPGTIPLRSLDVLRNISQNEARTFQKISRYIVSPGVLICNPKNEIFPPGILLKDIVTLLYTGLINNIESDLRGFSDKSKSINGFEYKVIKKDDLYFAVDSAKKIVIPGIMITTAGNTAFNICDRDHNDEADLKYMSSIICSYNENRFREMFVYKENFENNTHSFSKIYTHVQSFEDELKF